MLLNLSKLDIDLVLDWSETESATVVATYIEDGVLYQHLKSEDGQMLVVFNTDACDLEFDVTDIHIRLAYKLQIISDVEYKNYKDQIAEKQRQSDIKDARRQVQAMLNKYGLEALGL